MMKIIVRLFLFLFSVGLLVANTWNHFWARDLVIWDANLGYVGLAIMIISLVDVESIYEFSAGSFKLRRKIKEADDVLEHLRELITPVSEVALTVAVRGNRMGIRPIDRDRLEYLKNKIEDQLTKIYFPENADKKSNDHRRETFDKIFEELHKFHMRDLAQPIYTAIDNRLDEKAEKISGRHKSYPPPVTQDKKWRKIAPDLKKIAYSKSKVKEERNSFNFTGFRLKIIEFLRSLEVFDDKEVEEILSAINSEIDEVEYYEANKKFKYKEKC